MHFYAHKNMNMQLLRELPINIYKNLNTKFRIIRL